MLGIGKGGVRAQFEAWNRNLMRSSKVPILGIGNRGVQTKFRCLESGIEEFEPRSKLRIGNGGVPDKFDVCNRKWRSSTQVPMLGIGNE